MSKHIFFDFFGHFCSRPILFFYWEIASKQTNHVVVDCASYIFIQLCTMPSWVSIQSQVVTSDVCKYTRCQMRTHVIGSFKTNFKTKLK